MHPNQDVKNMLQKCLIGFKTYYFYLIQYPNENGIELRMFV